VGRLAGGLAVVALALPASRVDFTARVTGAGFPGDDPQKPEPYALVVLRDGLPFLVVPVLSDEFEVPFPGVLPGRYRLQLQRGTTIEAVSSPIYLEPPRH
jgi:hypothetical protein